MIVAAPAILLFGEHNHLGPRIAMRPIVVSVLASQAVTTLRRTCVYE
jgi:hypothetical protein